MKKIILILLAFAIFGSAYAQRKKKTKKTESGLEYRYVDKNKKARKPVKDDIIFLNLDYFIKDSVLFSSQKMLGSDLKINFIEPIYPGDVNEGLGLMREGDSLIFFIDAKKFYEKNMGNVPAFVQDGDKIEFRARLKRVLSPEEERQETVARNEKLQAEEQTKIDEYIKKEKIKEKPTESGLYFIETEKGRGVRAKKGDMVVVHYTGYLLDGTKFDSSKDRNQPFEFQLGQNRVIKGWEEGIAMMDVGDKATLIIPSKLGYGARGAGRDIPPFATLIFEVELLKIK